ncbi:unnamed protein product [Lactuca saligna]|uniref:Uncharacterized protein n=1 Tax=Lactuca saligna TaxID=75948 RepID=A0AA36E5I2_LACSI|nr:unnamed protein product [Lactuca saligna]
MKKDDTFSGSYSYSRKHTAISNNTRNNSQATSYNSTMQKGTDSPHSAGVVQSLLTAFVSINKIKHESISNNTLSEVPVLRTAKTDMEDLISRLNQEIAVKDYLTTKVKDLEEELETTKLTSKENLHQTILMERERITQMQWDMEELRRK